MVSFGVQELLRRGHAREKLGVVESVGGIILVIGSTDGKSEGESREHV